MAQSAHEVLSAIAPTFTSPPVLATPTLAHSNTPPAASPSVFFNGSTPFTPASAPASTLPYPLVASQTVPAPAAPQTPLQSNPAALVAQMLANRGGLEGQPPVQAATNNLLVAGLHPPPSFPQYTGPTGPIVNVRSNRNGTNERRQQSIQARSAFVQNLAMGRNGNQPVVVELIVLVDPLCCPNGYCHHPNADVHPDEPMTADYNIVHSDVRPLIARLQSLNLVIHVNVHKNAECYMDLQKALIAHQARSDTPKIPGFNPDPNADPDNSGWCLRQFRTTQHMTRLVCAPSARSKSYFTWANLTQHCSFSKAAKDSGMGEDPGLKNYLMISPAKGNIIHSVTDCYLDDFGDSPIHPVKAAIAHLCYAARALWGLLFLERTLGEQATGCDQRPLQLCRGVSPDLQPSFSSVARVRICPINPHTPEMNNHAPVLPHPSVSSAPNRTPDDANPSRTTSPIIQHPSDSRAQPIPPVVQPPFVPMHRLRTPPPFVCPKWDHPGRELRFVQSSQIDGDEVLGIMADSIPQAADALWQVLLHLGRLRSTLPHGETIDHRVHPRPTLPIGATVDMWWEPSAFTHVEIHLNDSPATGNSLLKSTLSVILARLLDPTHPDSCYGLLPGGSLYLYPRMPVYDLTIEQTAFWWAQGFFLAIWFLSTHQVPLLLFAPFVHVLLPKRVEDCRLQLDQWSPAAINNIDPMIAGFLRPWLDLKKTQPVSTYPSWTDRLKEPVPVFLMRHCAGIPSEVGLGSKRDPDVHVNHDRAIRSFHMFGNANFESLPAFRAYHSGFHQTLGPYFNSESSADSLPSLIKRTAHDANKSEHLFIYWLFNRKLEDLSQLQPYLNYDNREILQTEQGQMKVGGEEMLADLVLSRFRHALEGYLRKDIVNRGTRLLQTMTSCPYLPASDNDKLTFKFIQLDPKMDIQKPSGSKLLYSFVHACWSGADIGFDGRLVQILATGRWEGITIDAYFDTIFNVEHTQYNRA
ncbi:hypothetical protein ARMGADRAFT_1091602 [Armillaria gallica]|uniref:Uncharacterized protein n=1 Tax=Armillaria gallica TaxID=47427 RepID=A0A2H3CDB2_ARMGA|nr:hypothetical protein ARMGADRAFT_1091602 [Armillaria gallica]